MRTKSAGRAHRHKLWGKDQFLDDLRKHGSIKAVCEIYGDPDPKKSGLPGWRAYYSDVWRWRKPKGCAFDRDVEAVLLDLGTTRPNSGRPRNDGGDKSWQETYCQALVRHKLALDKAAAETPYSVRQIEDFLDPVCSSYDPEFEKMVREAELIVSSRSREALVSLQDEHNWVDGEAAKVSQSKAWFHFKMAEKLEPTKFGRRQVQISGTIDHRHQHRMLPPGERVAMLLEDRQRFMEARSQDVKALPEGANIGVEINRAQEVLEAEVVEDDA